MTTGGDHQGRETSLVESGGMIKPRLVDRRRLPSILGSTEHHDHIHLSALIVAGLRSDVPIKNTYICHQYGDGEQDKEATPPAGLRPSTHPSTSVISSLEMAPSRMMRQPFASVRSTIVEGTLRGVLPPSTISGKRSPICRRTLSAVVHSAAPLRLAEVAVIGNPNPRTIAIGISAAGTRNATLPLFAVTLSGSRDDALTMIVSGPGQKRRARI